MLRRLLVYRGRSHRRLAVMLALLCLLGQLSNLAHLLLVQHTTCPQDGELVHHATVVAADREARSAAGADQVPLGSLAQGAPQERAHDHCLTSTQRRSAGLCPPLHPTGVIAPTTASVPSHADRRASHPGIALLRLAPKSSPPRV